MPSSDLPFVVDLSRYQGFIDWDTLVAHNPKVEMVLIRASISWGYKDTYLDRNWSESRRVRIPRGAYTVFYPNQDPKRQMAHFINCLGDDFGEAGPVLDVELGDGDHACTPEHYQKNMLIALRYLEAETRFKHKPIIYSRASFINEYVTGLHNTPPTWYDEFDWHLAQYLLSGEEHPGPPNMPSGVSRERCLLHQTSAKGDGNALGFQSASADLNRWQDVAYVTLPQYLGTPTEPKPEPPTPTGECLWDEARIAKIENQVITLQSENAMQDNDIQDIQTGLRIASGIVE